MFSCATAALIFIAYFSLSVLNALYVRNVMSKRAAVAASLGAGSTFVSAVGVLTYTENAGYIVPMVLGSWIGIFCSVRLASRE